jgi:hypothetical protein
MGFKKAKGRSVNTQHNGRFPNLQQGVFKQLYITRIRPVKVFQQEDGRRSEGKCREYRLHGLLGIFLFYAQNTVHPKYGSKDP